MKHLNRTSGHCENEQQCHFQVASPEHFFLFSILQVACSAWVRMFQILLFRISYYSARQFDANTHVYATPNTNLGQWNFNWFFDVQNRTLFLWNRIGFCCAILLMLLSAIRPMYEKFRIALLLVARGNIALEIIGKASGISFVCVSVFWGNRWDEMRYTTNHWITKNRQKTQFQSNQTNAQPTNGSMFL